MTMIVFTLLGAGALLCLYQLIRGPGNSDRIICLDTLNMMIVGLTAMLALVYKNSLYLDIAIVYAILAFIETIIFSRYMEGKI